MTRDIALVLSSGGARGFAHIGAIRVLEREGYRIRSIAGSSMGALVGGIHATGQLKEFEDFVRSLDIRDVLKLTDVTISKRGFVKGKKVIEKMKEIIPDRNIEELPIPFCAVATDIINGTERIFTEGKLYDAIRASISIPTVFQPFNIGEHFYMDGGVLNPVPILHVKRHPGDLLVVVYVNAQVPFEHERVPEPKPMDPETLTLIRRIQAKLHSPIPKDKKDDIGIFNLTNRSLSLMLNRIALMTLEGNKPDVLVNIPREAYGTFDFYKAKEIIKLGEKETEKALRCLSPS